MSAEGLSGSVLLTSVGSRVDLVDGFRSAVGDLGRVLACDRDAGAAALAFSDLAIESPPFRSPRYLVGVTA